MKKILLILLFVVMTISARAETIKIVAIVNDDIITSYDFYNRIDMAMINSNLPKNQENFSKIASVVMQKLIIEKLKVQNAKKVGLNVSEKEIDDAIETIAQRNNVGKAEFLEKIEESGLQIDTLKSQIEANLMWNKYIAKMIAPRVDIPDEEVKEFLKKVQETESEATKESVRYKLTMDKIEILEKRKLRDLKDSAFIEVKMK